MKKFLSVILALAMAMSLSVSAFATDFNDVSSSHTNYEAIDTLKTLDIVNGYSATKYGPNDILTRAQLCTMIVRAIYGDDTHYNSVNVFNDVSVSHWARIYIDTAYNHGLMSGYGDGAFGPEDNLTYTQTARVILNTLGYGKLDWPLGVNTVAYELGLYDDVAVSDFNAGCTRAHAAQMIYNAFDCKTVKEYAGQHFPTKDVFLEDILGYEKTIDLTGSAPYVAYKDISVKNGKTYTTHISAGDTIYFKDSIFKYTLTDSKRAEVKTVDYDDVNYYVNGVDTTTIKIDGIKVEKTTLDTLYKDCDAIGVFDEKDKLTDIYILHDGFTWVPATGEYDGPAMGTKWDNEVTSDDDYDVNTSTITYFPEDGSYEISNHVEYGYVKETTTNTFYIGNVKYRVENHGLNTGDFATIFYDIHGNISGVKAR